MFNRPINAGTGFNSHFPRDATSGITLVVMFSHCPQALMQLIYDSRVSIQNHAFNVHGITHLDLSFHGGWLCSRRCGTSLPLRTLHILA